MNKKGGRPQGSKNTPKRTLDLRDFIPPEPVKAPKFIITSSQRKLLKQYNPDGLPDFRTRDFKNLSYDEKDNYIAEQLAIAIENRKEFKQLSYQEKENNIIGDVKYNIINYDTIAVLKKVKKDLVDQNILHIFVKQIRKRVL